MNTEELTQVVTAHQSAIVRGESRLDRMEAILERLVQQQEVNQQTTAPLTVDRQTHKPNLDQLTPEQQLTKQNLDQLTASIRELRQIVDEDIRRRSRTE